MTVFTSPHHSAMTHSPKTDWHQLSGITQWLQQRVDSGQEREIWNCMCRIVLKLNGPTQISEQSYHFNTKCRGLETFTKSCHKTPFRFGNRDTHAWLNDKMRIVPPCKIRLLGASQCSISILSPTRLHPCILLHTGRAPRDSTTRPLNTWA